MTDYVVYGGNGCSLGAMREEYIPLLLPFINDPEVVEGVTAEPPLTLEEELEWFRGIGKLKPGNIIFAILRHGENEDSPLTYVGHTGLHRINRKDGRAVTGTIIFRQDEWNKGIGTEAKLLLLYDAFRVRGLRKVTSSVKAFNARSLGHLIKAGYTIVGRYRNHLFYDGGYVDEIILEVHREQWEPIWETYKSTGQLPKLTDAQRALVSKETGVPSK